MDTAKQTALDIALSSIEKDHGKGAVMRLGEMSASLVSEAISTGSLSGGHGLGHRRDSQGAGH